MPGNLKIAQTEITIKGQLLPGTVEACLAAVTVDDAVDLPSMFALEFQNSDASFDRRELLLDQSQFAIGSEVEIKLGYENQLTSVIQGEITGLEPAFTSSELPKLTVRGYDCRHRLQRGRKVRTFLKQKDSAIAASIAKEAGLSAEVQDSRVVHDYVAQANQTDMEFLLERAQQIHYEVRVQDKKLLFKPVANADSAIVTLTSDDNLVEFYPRLSSAGQVSEVTVQGWDPKEKKEIIGKAQQGAVAAKMGGTTSGPALIANAFSSAVGLMSGSPIATKAEADQAAQALLSASALTLITGEGVCLGRPDLRAGKVIQIDGLGKRFSGRYYLTAVSHRLEDGGYTVHFTVRRNAS